MGWGVSVGTGIVGWKVGVEVSVGGIIEGVDVGCCSPRLQAVISMMKHKVAIVVIDLIFFPKESQSM